MSRIWGGRRAALPKRTPEAVRVPGALYRPALTRREHDIIDQLLDAVPGMHSKVVEAGRFLADDLREFGTGEPDAAIAGYLVRVLEYLLDMHEQIKDCVAERGGDVNSSVDWHGAYDAVLDTMGIAVVDLTAIERL